MRLVAVIPPLRALPPAREPVVPSPAEHLKALAWECRRLAAVVSDEITRRDLMSVAEKFERLARIRGREKADGRSG